MTQFSLGNKKSARGLVVVLPSHKHGIKKYFCNQILSDEFTHDTHQIFTLTYTQLKREKRGGGAISIAKTEVKVKIS